MPGMWELPEMADMNGEAGPSFTLRHSITVTDYTVRVWRCAASRERRREMDPVGAAASGCPTGLARKILRKAEML